MRLAKILLRLEKGNIELIIFSLYQCFGLEWKISRRKCTHMAKSWHHCFAYRCPFSSPSWWHSYPYFWFWRQSSANPHGSISTACYLCWAALYFTSFLSTISLDGLRKSQVSNRGAVLLWVKRRWARRPATASVLILPRRYHRISGS